MCLSVFQALCNLITLGPGLPLGWMSYFLEATYRIMSSYFSVPLDKVREVDLYQMTNLQGWNVFLQISYVEALTPDITVFGDKTFKEVIKVNKWDCKYGHVRTRVLIRRGKTTKEEAVWGHCKKEAVCKPRWKGLRKNQTYEHFDLGHPASRTVRRLIFVA